VTGSARVDAPLVGSLAADPAVRFAFSGREDGNLSHTVGSGQVFDARARLAARVGARPEDAVYMEQVHGARAARVSRSDAGRGLNSREDAIPGTDALVTFDSDVALHVLVADCVPLLLAEPGGAIATVHAGREGVRAGVVQAAVNAMEPSRPAVVEAVLGPSIGACCYEVSAELRAAVTAVVPQAWATTTEGMPALDLRAAVQAQLGAAGIERIEQRGGCTRCDPQRWFSHRADADGPTGGRQGAVINRVSGVQHLRGSSTTPS
jgi:polyphenol oxidase